MTFALVVCGLALLLFGGEALVRGAVGIAERLGMSPLIIGLTLVGFGTSAPELLTSIKAALAGSPGLALGNVVGSNIANVLLILGLSALIFPLKTDFPALKRDGGMMLAAAIATVGIGLYGVVTQAIGGVLVICLIVYIAAAFRSERQGSIKASIEPAAFTIAEPPVSMARTSFYAIGGLGLVVLGADWLVRGAIILARDYGLSETVIGLTVVAVGTSLPELATSAVAAFRRNADIAVGNIVGSNIYNIFGILGVTALIEPVAVPDRIANADSWIMLGVTVLFLIFAATGARIKRREGAFFLLAYMLYLVWLGAVAGASGAI